MKRRSRDTLELGPEVVQMLLPHRPPFLMVDRVTRLCRDTKPSLCAARYITANEAVFSGHFPGLKLWPGVYTIEGLGQACNLLAVLRGMLRHCEENDRDPEKALDALRNLELGMRMKPTYRREDAMSLLEQMPDAHELLGLTTSVQVKLLAPVFAGSCLEYCVRELDVIGETARWDVEAAVNSQPVAKGIITGTRMAFPVRPEWA